MVDHGSAGSAPTTDLAADVVAGRYEILGLVGAGGMGAVYRARDRELDEVVALKVLRRELSYDPQALARFRREVKLARRVTHRNVARTFDIGEHDGVAFLTMELVEGESLSQRLARKKTLPVERACEIAVAIAGGLDAAHQAGVVHRDLKPDNVMLSRDGRVVVTDFGVAFAEEAFAADARRIVGTPAYMAPEQLETPEKIDGRADVYALGLVLYEMLTGQLPWTGQTELAVATARLSRPPRDPRELQPGLAPALVALLFSALARHAGERLPSAGTFATKLAAIVIPSTTPTLADESGVYASLAPPPPPARRLAVLPLRHSGDAADDYLTAGIGEAMVDALAAAAIRVRACPAAMLGRDPQDAGRELGADAVVTGAVEVTSSELRVSLRLVGSQDGFVLWAGRFSGGRGDAIAIANSAGSQIVQALSGAEQAAPSRGLAVSPEAVDLYLRGRRTYHRFWRTAEAVGLLERALAKAPDDPRILAALALALCRETGAEIDTEAAREAARARAERALELGPSLAEAHVALAVARLREGAAMTAATLLRRALDLAPGNVDALEHAGRVLLETRALEEGIAHAELAMRVEPLLGLVLPYHVLRARALLGEWDAVDAAFRDVPGETAARLTYWLTRARLGIWRKSPEHRRRILAELEADSFPNKAFPLAYASYLRDDGPGPVERSLLADRMSDRRSSPRQRSFFAQLRAELAVVDGDLEGAMGAVEAAVREGLLDEAWIDRCPAIDPLRDDPRFARAQAEVHERAAAVVAALLGGAPGPS